MIMKIIKSLLLSMCLVLAASCDLDLLDDPNAIKLEQVNSTLLLNNIQIDFASFFNTASTFGMQPVRMMNSGGSNYETMNRANAYDGLWDIAYAGILNDAHVLIEKADAEGLTRHAGMAKVLSAYTLSVLVDYFEGVPYSEGFGGLTNLNPNVDTPQENYAAAIALLDEAIIDFTTLPNPSGEAVFDFYYGSDFTRWIRLANTLKLKLYLNQRVADVAGATAGINAVLAHSGGIINSQATNFIFRYSTSAADPNARHPRWTANWLTGAGDYMSNYFMWQMNYGYNLTDPRMRFYLYRQRTSNSSNPNEIRCILEQIPSHYPQAGPAPGEGGFPPSIDQTNIGAWSRTFCFPTGSGYWGRDHVDPQGIPPDGLARTTWGSYPIGGRFDANNGLAVTSTTTSTNSMRGAGFQPIMMRAYVDFMLAEALQYLTLVGVPAPNTSRLRLDAGIRNSMADVRFWAVNGTFGSNGFGASPNQAATIETFQSATAYQTAVDTYVTAALTSPVFGFDAQAAGDAQMNYIAREYWIALFGNGIEAYNLYRRTGMPTGMQPTINPASGAFPRSFWYPTAFEARNSNVVQKDNLTTKLFWDMTTSNLDF